MVIADKIKKVAATHGKTISQIASEMGVAQSQLSRTINNERISLKDIAAICDAIGCDMSEIFSKEYSFTCPNCGCKLEISVKQSE